MSSASALYIKSSGLAYARGTIVGQDLSNNTGYAQIWSTIAADFGVVACTQTKC